MLCQTVSKVPPSISDAGWVFDYKSVPQLQGGVRVQVVLHQHLYRHRHNNRMCRSWIPSAVHSFRCASFLKILTWQSWHKHTHCASLSWMFDSVHYPIKWKSTRCTGGDRNHSRVIWPIQLYWLYLSIVLSALNALDLHSTMTPIRISVLLLRHML